MRQRLPPTLVGSEIRAHQAFTRLLMRYDQCIRSQLQFEVEEGNPDSILYQEWQIECEDIRRALPVLAWVLGVSQGALRARLEWEEALPVLAWVLGVSPGQAFLALDCIDGCVGRSSCLAECEEVYMALMAWIAQGSDPQHFADITFPLLAHSVASRPSLADVVSQGDRDGNASY